MRQLDQNNFSLRITNYNELFNDKEMPFWIYSEVIDKFMTMLGNIDEYTEYHCFRVAILTKMFLKYAIEREGNKEIDDLNEVLIKEIVYGAYVHDIGKSQVPSYIIKQKEKLEESEWLELKNHPLNGAFLFMAPGYENIRNVILCHHERYDGQGYPMQYAGKNIPLGGRIVCLMDSFDAMTDKRPYQNNEPLDLDGALEEINRFSGKQFDPELVEIFNELVKTDEFKNYWNIKKNRDAIKNETESVKTWLFNNETISEKVANAEKNIAVMKKILNLE